MGMLPRNCMARRVSWAEGSPPFERRARAAQPPQFTRHPHNQLEPEGPGSAKPVHEVSEQAYTSQSMDLTPALVTRHTHSHIAAVLHGAPRVHAPRNVGVGHDEVTPENSLAKGERVETAERSIEGSRGGGGAQQNRSAGLNQRASRAPRRRCECT